ncbi:hypothetical protein V1477_017208, partial [Vespula maculifrons]
MRGEEKRGRVGGRDGGEGKRPPPATAAVTTLCRKSSLEAHQRKKHVPMEDRSSRSSSSSSNSSSSSSSSSSSRRRRRRRSTDTPPRAETARRAPETDIIAPDSHDSRKSGSTLDDNVRGKSALGQVNTVRQILRRCQEDRLDSKENERVEEKRRRWNKMMGRALRASSFKFKL